MLNLLVSPSLVFDEVVVNPAKTANWLVPTILVCLSSLLALPATTDPQRSTSMLGQFVEAGALTQPQATAMQAHWTAIARLALCAVVLAGTIWSASVIWLIGRFLLKRRFPFVKALEVAGLSASILILAAAVTGLLALAVGDPSARPALSLVCSRIDPNSTILALAGALNVFHIWSASVLAIGLARLSAVTFKEAAFWVFGFWIVLRMTLIILG